MRSILRIFLVCVITCLILAANSPVFAQTIWHVDDDAPNDPGPGDPEVSDPLEDGSTEHPFDVISEGIDAATDGDTVLIADGYYTGDVHGDIRFFGKAITVKSEDGPEQCILDCNFNSRGFIFNTGEGMDSILEGLTIRKGSTWLTDGGGIYCVNSSPTIISNIIEDCIVYYGTGAAIYCNGGAPLIAGNVIRNNYTTEEGSRGGGIGCVQSSPQILNNQIHGNSAVGGYYSWTFGGGIYLSSCNAELVNNLIVDNAAYTGGGVYSRHGPLVLSNCTIFDNRLGYGVHLHGEESYTLKDCVVWGNDSGGLDTGSFAEPAVTFCDIQGGWQGEGNFDADPLFASGPAGDYCLGHIAAGQPADSPCIDAGSQASQDACFEYGGDTYCAHRLTTRTDEYSDILQLDVGFHYPLRAIEATVTCVPSWGTIPFITNIGVTLHNRFGVARTIAGRVNAVLAGGDAYQSYRSGFAQIAAHEILEIHWQQVIPNLDMVDGANRLTLLAADVTAAPYNQPPYPPSGETDTAACTIHGSSGKTLSVSIAAAPTSGILPDTSEISVELRNTTGYHRQLAFRVSRTLADGSYDPHYRNGFQNIAPFSSHSMCWEESFPEDASVTGLNSYHVLAQDVTPAPYNLPPLPVAGDTDTADCSFEGMTALFQTWYVDDNAPNDPGPGDPAVSDPAEDGSADHPFDAIQEAIDAALERDFVQVADGLYTGEGNRDLSYRGKRLTVHSENGPAVCIVDCQGSSSDRHRGFNFESQETNESILRGITIRNGWHDEGAGIRCYVSSPVFVDCVIVENTVGENSYRGGTVLSYSSSPMFQRCLISRNTTVGEHGWGVGLYCTYSTVQLVDSVIDENTAPLYDSYGGGIFCVSSTLRASNCLISDNSVSGDGGGVYVSSNEALFENCTISGNSCGTSGGGGIIVGSNGTITIRDCILWDNTPGSIEYHGSAPDVSWSDIQGGFAGTGNIDLNPLFIEGPTGKFYLAQTAAGQLVDSPCLDTGSDLAENICIPLFDGTVCLDELTTRTDLIPDSGQVDMGYHHPAGTLP